MGEEVLTSRRTYIYLGVIVACFATIYPIVLHPFMKNALGYGSPPAKSEGVHPKSKVATDKDKPKPPPGHPDFAHFPSHMQHGRPHPGAFEGGTKKAGGSGGRGGMMAMILPVYAVGIIGFLLYTVFKVFSKMGKKEETETGPYGQKKQKDPVSLVRDRLAKMDLDKVLETGDEDGLEELNALVTMLQQEAVRTGESTLDSPTKMEDILEDSNEASCDDQGSGDSVEEGEPEATSPETENKKDDTKEGATSTKEATELAALQQRLAQTEAEMRKIMEAMNHLATTSASLATTTDEVAVKKEDLGDNKDDEDDSSDENGSKANLDSEADTTSEVAEVSGTTDSESPASKISNVDDSKPEQKEEVETINSDES